MAEPAGIAGSLRRLWRLAGAIMGIAWRVAPGLTVICAISSLLGGAVSLAYPIAFRVIIDAAIAHNAGRAVGGVALTTLTFGVSWVVSATSGSRLSQLTDRCNLALGEHIGQLVNAVPSLEHFERADYLVEIDGLRADRRTLAGAPRQVLRLLQVGIQVGGITLLLALIYPPVLVVPLLAVFPGLADRRASLLQKRSEDSLADSSRLLEALFTLSATASPARELRTFGATAALSARHAALGEQISAATLRAARRSALWEASGWVIYAVGFVGAIVILVLRAAHGHVSPGEVVEAVSLIRRVQGQVSGATDTAGSFATATRAAKRLLWLEDYQASATSSGHRAPPQSLEQGIRLEGLSFCYPGTDTLSLAGVDLLLPAGSTVALVGENGAGKTTLVKLLTGMYRPTEGRITIDGTDLAEIDLVAWRELTTATFQDFVQFQMRLGDGVGAGDLPRLGDDEAVRAAIERAGAAPLVEGMAEGLDTVVGSYIGGRNLSGGQWQRVALARGLMREAPLLAVLDEPTASLDARAEKALFERYHALARRSRKPVVR